MSADVLIRKQRIRIRVADNASALQIRSQLNDSFQYDLIALFQKVFASFANEDMYLNIDKLTIDIGQIEKSDFDSRFLGLIEQKLITQIKKISQTGSHLTTGTGTRDVSHDSAEIVLSPVLETKNKQQVDALLYFMEHGIYPWWFNKNYEQDPGYLFEHFTTTDWIKFIAKLFSICHKTPGSIHRLAERIFNSLPQQLYKHLIEITMSVYDNGDISASITEIIKKYEEGSTSNIAKKEFYKTLLLSVLSSPNIDDIKHAVEGIKEQLQKLQGNENKISSVDRIHKNLDPDKTEGLKKQPQKKEYEEVFISNAGLILLHPFLENLFAVFDLIDSEKKFTSPESKNRAAVLLSYLQSGSETCNEWNMFFNKIICNIPPGAVIPADIILTQKEKEECTHLLQTVINYWSALKGASIEALQNTFISRDGKLSWQQDHWLLQVERTGVDILLDKLPWNFAIVKLPWLESLIYTEW